MGFPKGINCETFFQLFYMRFLGYKVIGMRFWGFNFKVLRIGLRLRF